jgi:transposase
MGHASRSGRRPIPVVYRTSPDPPRGCRFCPGRARRGGCTRSWRDAQAPSAEETLGATAARRAVVPVRRRGHRAPPHEGPAGGQGGPRRGTRAMLRTGRPWRYLPHDLPSWQTCYVCFRRFRRQGVSEKINEVLAARRRGHATVVGVGMGTGGEYTGRTARQHTPCCHGCGAAASGCRWSWWVRCRLVASAQEGLGMMVEVVKKVTG